MKVSELIEKLKEAPANAEVGIFPPDLFEKFEEDHLHQRPEFLAGAEAALNWAGGPRSFDIDTDAFGNEGTVFFVPCYV